MKAIKGKGQNKKGKTYPWWSSPGSQFHILLANSIVKANTAFRYIGYKSRE
jgi:hypothetical protein